MVTVHDHGSRYLIVGLGNPGREYEQTRHNVGSMLADRLAALYDFRFQNCGHSYLGRAVVSGFDVAVAKPRTYMNLSGRAVVEAQRTLAVPVENIIAAYDDCDLPLGRIRIKEDGGSGGHKGIASIVNALEDSGFLRIRLGIGRPVSEREGLKDYVLEPFNDDEADAVDAMLKNGVAAIETIIKDGAATAMNRFNGVKNVNREP
ncbi:MAG: aminoacyl-tRNA hydrolase [Deltaproteobacteria bacterium]|nr:aminoacyl-tRNA hydrolase [Deltaproteobacteria bacterium]